MLSVGKLATGQADYYLEQARGRVNAVTIVAERTVEADVKQIFQKLDLAANPDSHRRVLAVLAYFRGS